VSSNSLLPIEKFSVGGLDSVRGYRSNQLVRDRGYAASLQYQVPVFKNATGMRNLQFAAFVDTGYAKNKSGPEINPNSITGVGVGLIWDPDRRVHLELYYANGLKDVPEGGEYSIQDESLYFRLVATPW
jgi:hemolysin activation/secretion protein